MTTPRPPEAPARTGIEALNVYCGLAQVSVPAVFEGRGLDPDRLDNLMMQRRSVGLPFEDPVTNAVNAARPMLERIRDADRERIEMVVVSTESGLDYSKSVASYVHELLGLGRHCRVVEVKQACHAATVALQLTAGYVASGVSPGAKALVIATDVSLVDERAGYAEPAMGSGAVALLIGGDPQVLALDPGAFGCYSYETLDSARPDPTFDVADADRSLFTYLDCLSNSYRDYSDRVEGADIADTFDFLAMHTPFAGMVRAAHRKLMREFAPGRVGAVEEDFQRRVAPSLTYPGMVGNLCSGSVYLALASLLDSAPVTGAARVGLYAYGSGCSAEFFSGVVDAGSTRAVGETRIDEQLASRCELTFGEYEELISASRRCLVPERDREVELDRYAPLLTRFGQQRDVLAYAGTKDYHRHYEWLAAG